MGWDLQWGVVPRARIWDHNGVQKKVQIIPNQELGYSFEDGICKTNLENWVQQSSNYKEFHDWKESRKCKLETNLNTKFQVKVLVCTLFLKRGIHCAVRMKLIQHCKSASPIKI